jgi:hypothetical protein
MSNLAELSLQRMKGENEVGQKNCFSFAAVGNKGTCVQVFVTGVINLQVVCGNRVARFFFTQYTKTEKKIPNYHNFTKMSKNIPNDRKIFRMTIKYTSIFHSKALQNLPKLEFLV